MYTIIRFNISRIIDIKHSYTGGSTDMFIPSNASLALGLEAEPLYCYDINSLLLALCFIE